jgi:hypothetical protein
VVNWWWVFREIGDVMEMEVRIDIISGFGFVFDGRGD